jgi:hypothetical protein
MNRMRHALIILLVAVLAVFFVTRLHNDVSKISTEKTVESIGYASNAPPLLRAKSDGAHIESPTKNDGKGTPNEIWVEKVTKNRPRSFQRALDESPPKNLRFSPSKQLENLDGGKASLLDYTINQIPIGRIVIDGKTYDEGGTLGAKNKDLIIIRFKSETMDNRLVRVADENNCTTIANLPKLNYNENRRWWIQEWSWLSDSELIGSSFEEDDQSSCVVKSHLYLYDYTKETLCTLVPPPGVNPYQTLSLDGINRGARALKMSDESGNIYYLKIE